MANPRKMLIVADNHEDRQPIEDLIHIYEGEVDHMLHLGDSMFPDLDKVWQQMIPIKGNNDSGEGYIEQTVVCLGEAKIFATHGHQLDVGKSRGKLAEKAKEKNCQFACYGHTHETKVEEIDGVLVINPGSISQPRGPVPRKLYAILSVDEDRHYQLEYYDHNHREVKELSASGEF